MLARPNLSGQKRGRFTFRPDFVAQSIADIDFAALEKLGVKAVFVDLDGTVVARGRHEVDPDTSRILEQISMKVYIATNRPKNRGLKNLVNDLNAQGSAHPHGLWGKPSPRYFKNALRDKGFDPHEAVMVGDRYLQDMLGANLAGMYSLLVGKLDPPANAFDRLLSGLERRFTERLAKKYR